MELVLLRNVTGASRGIGLAIAEAFAAEVRKSRFAAEPKHCSMLRKTNLPATAVKCTSTWRPRRHFAESYINAAEAASAD